MPDPPIEPPSASNLKEVALLLDVHYMTVYRYVRHGRLPATTAADILDAIGLTDGLVAIGIGVTTAARFDAAVDIIATIRAAHPSLPVLLGGQAMRNPEIAELAGACSWSAGPDLIDTLTSLVSRARSGAGQPR